MRVINSKLTRVSCGLLALLALSPLSQAQTTNRPSGTVVSWGTQVIPYVAPGTRFIAIAAETDHTLGLTSDGAVVGWGRQSAVPVAWQSDVVAIAAGAPNLALKRDGSVVAGGSVPVAAQTGVVAIAAGYGHRVALKNDGSVVAWGANDFGQTDVPIEAQSNVVAIAAGGFREFPPWPAVIYHGHTVALKSDGSVIAWGEISFGQTLVPATAQSGVTAVAAGPSHTVALKSDGSVLAWGDNADGQTDVPIGAQSGVLAIAAGGYIERVPGVGYIARGYTVALKGDGSVIAWGYNGQGQTEVPSAAQSDVAGISAGGGAAFALKGDGSVVAWGYNGSCQTMVPGLNGVVDIAAGCETIVVLKSDGSVTASGGSTTTVPVAAQSGVIAISTRCGHILALKDDGSVVAWGDNYFGQTDVPVEAQSGVIGIAAGHTYSLALKNNGSVVAWGSDSTVPVEWQSGVIAIADGLALKADGSVVTFWGATVPVAAQSGVTAIATGWGHQLALKDDGSVVAWGDNSGGQTAVPAAARNGVVAIAAGTDHSVAVKGDGSVVAWGGMSDINNSGQTQVPVGLPPAFAIAAGYALSVALVQDPPPSLTLLRNADQTVSLSWTGAGTLEQADSLTAPNWQTSPIQDNPQILSTTNLMHFFRVKAE